MRLLKAKQPEYFILNFSDIKALASLFHFSNTLRYRDSFNLQISIHAVFEI